MATMKAGSSGIDSASDGNMISFDFWKELAVLAPFDMNKITNIGNVNPGMVAVLKFCWILLWKGSWVRQLSYQIQLSQDR